MTRTLDDAVAALPVQQPHECSYLPGLVAQNQSFYWFAEDDPMPADLYQQLMDRHFRRSGRILYRPQCAECRKCVPIRLALDAFAPSRSQARAEQKNRDVTVRWAPPRFTAEKVALYARYCDARHAPGEAKSAEQRGEELRAFLYDSPTETLEGEYRAGDALIAVSLVDLTPVALSAVYFYFDPNESRRSLGVFSALAEIELARQLGCTHYYLGYWVEGCRKMDYKAAFADHELLVEGAWQKRARRL